MTGRSAFRPGLRLRLWLAAAVLAALAVAAAAIAVYGLSRTHGHAAEAMAAQRRIEGYGAFSAQVNDWMLGWLTRQDGPPDAAPVLAALNGLDRLVAEDVAAAPSGAEATQRARQSVTPARLRALFGQLDAVLDKTPPGTPVGDAAVAFYAAQAPAAAAQQAEQEMRRRDAALAAMERLQRPLLMAAIGVGVAAPIVLAALYLLVLHPLFARLARGAASAQAMAMGSPPADEDGGPLEGIVGGRPAALSAAKGGVARADATRRRFFADVGHELRTPLTVIMGEAELGLRRPDPAARAGFDTILNRAARLYRRIEDLLRIARSDSGQLELQQGRVALDQAVAAALADLAPVLKRAGVGVTTDLAALAVRGDADWLRQGLSGPFGEARQNPGGGGAVSVTGRAEGGMARVLIRDTGPGLPPDLRGRVFERFARGSTAPGFGVGLALAAWVVEASGGRLELMPEDGPGLGLRMDLPLWEEG